MRDTKENRAYQMRSGESSSLKETRYPPVWRRTGRGCQFPEDQQPWIGPRLHGLPGCALAAGKCSRARRWSHIPWSCRAPLPSCGSGRSLGRGATRTPTGQTGQFYVSWKRTTRTPAISADSFSRSLSKKEGSSSGMVVEGGRKTRHDATVGTCDPEIRWR